MIKVQIFAQSHNQNAIFQTIAQSICKFCNLDVTNKTFPMKFKRIHHNQTQSLNQYGNKHTIAQSHNRAINIKFCNIHTITIKLVWENSTNIKVLPP